VHSTFFAMKRVFQSSLRVGRELLAPFGLTPARFDLMYLLPRSTQRGIKQSDVTRSLGVTAPTVSRMVKSLVELGLVVSNVWEADMRQRWLRMTQEGVEVLRAAIAATMDSGDAHGIVLRAVVPRYFDPVDCIRVLDYFENGLDRVRTAFADTGYIYYPWHPDD
jgi:DNA-binding MarR family transcriptional regulator